MFELVGTQVKHRPYWETPLKTEHGKCVTFSQDVYICREGSLKAINAQRIVSHTLYVTDNSEFLSPAGKCIIAIVLFGSLQPEC